MTRERNADPACATCEHVSTDHPRAGRCGATVDDDDENGGRCPCARLVEACACTRCGNTLAPAIRNCPDCPGG